MHRIFLKYFILFTTIFVLSIAVSAQYQSRGKEFNYVDAESFYNGGNYYDALPLYIVLMNENPNYYFGTKT